MKAKSILGFAITLLGFTLGDPARAQFWDQDTHRRHEEHIKKVLDEDPCLGVGATPLEVAKVMQPGRLTKFFGSSGGDYLPLYARHRTCNEVTGCTKWEGGALELRWHENTFHFAVLDVIPGDELSAGLSIRTSSGDGFARGGGGVQTPCELSNGEIRCGALITGATQVEYLRMLGQPVTFNGVLTNKSPTGEFFSSPSGLCLWMKARTERIRGSYRDESELVFFESGIDQSMPSPW